MLAKQFLIRFSGNPSLLRWLDVSKDNTLSILDKELAKLVSEFETNFTASVSKPEAATKKSPSPAKMKRQKLRRARTKNGLLISSLRKKIYHCNCIDCQAKRKAEGKPAYLEPIGKIHTEAKFNFQSKKGILPQCVLKYRISRICKLN